MKKMIAILVLCAFVSVSSAAVVFQTESLEVQEGATFTVNVVSTDAATASLSVSVAITDAVSWANNSMKLAGTFNTNGTLIAPGNIVNLAIRGASGTAAAGSSLAANVVLFSFDVRAGAAGTTIVINDYNGSAASAGLSGGPMQTKWTMFTGGSDVAQNLDLGALSVNVVPEPMTMALLGLGGLFIRRRRA